MKRMISGAILISILISITSCATTNEEEKTDPNLITKRNSFQLERMH